MIDHAIYLFTRSLVMDALFTPEEVSEKLKLRTETIYRYIREGKLPAAKFGRKYRVTPEALQHFIVANTAGTEASYSYLPTGTAPTEGAQGPLIIGTVDEGDKRKKK
jgi:excisionase family DNA binding protein